MSRPPSPFEKYHTYMRGWRDGSGSGIVRRDHEEHLRLGEFYRQGYSDGRDARILASTAAARHFKYVPQILRVWAVPE